MHWTSFDNLGIWLQSDQHLVIKAALISCVFDIGAAEQAKNMTSSSHRATLAAS